MSAEFERVTGELEERRTPKEAEAPALRPDLNQQNGHCAPKPEDSETARRGSRDGAAGHPVQNATESERTPVEPDRSAPRLPGQVQQYSFDHPTSKPAPREASSPKKRRQP